MTDDDTWSRFVDAVGSPAWATDPRYATTAGRLADHDALDAHIEAWTADQPAEKVEALLAAAGIPAGKVQRTRDLRVDPQYLHRRFYRRLEHAEVGVIPYAGHQFRIRGYDNGLGRRPAVRRAHLRGPHRLPGDDPRRGRRRRRRRRGRSSPVRSEPHPARAARYLRDGTVRLVRREQWLAAGRRTCPLDDSTRRARTMPSSDTIEFYKGQNREVTVATPGEPLLGPFRNLPGVWEGSGTGWNMIALPFKPEPGSPLNYRLLLNQFDETLNFTLVDKGVPQPGLDEDGKVNTDQVIATLDYEQVVHQTAVTDRPASTVTGSPGRRDPPRAGPVPQHAERDRRWTDRGPARHHPPRGRRTGARHRVRRRRPTPHRADQRPPHRRARRSSTSRYLEPYKFFHETPFFGTVPAGVPGFPGFDPVEPHKLLQLANELSPVARTTVIELDTSSEPGGINNIPFIVKQANAVSMKSTFWINELEAKDANGNPRLQLQYAQIVMLDFFDRFDGLPGRIAWPHVSINTLEKKADTPAGMSDMVSR